MTPNIKIIIDCDGVLTDGKVWYDHNGHRTKAFHSRDIWGIRDLISRGYEVQIMTASSWPGLPAFASRTGATVTQQRIKTAEGPYIAVVDDVWDIELARGAIESFFPADAFLAKIADTLALEVAPTILKTKGGEGVIAELATLI